MYQGSTLADATAVELTELYSKAAASPVEVLDAVLERIEHFNPIVNAFCFLDREGARQQAVNSGKRWRRGETRSAADGVPATIKDLHAVHGWPLGRGTKTAVALKQASEDAPIVARLREAGVVLVGATTTPEFGWIGITVSPATGITRNPHDTRLSSGGSSGGAAVAASLGCGVLHTGSDALGSIRIPAAFCGVAGLKPTYGRVPSHPSSVMGSLSHTGPITRTIDDTALMLDIVAQRDRREWSPPPCDAAPCRPSINAGVKGLKVGLCQMVDGVSPTPEIEGALVEAADVLRRGGAEIQPLTLDLSAAALAVKMFWKVGCAVLVESVPEREWRLLDPGLLTAAQAGRSISAIELRKAEFSRDSLTIALSEIMSGLDLLLLPTLPLRPFDAISDVPDTGQFASWLDWNCSCFAFNLTQNPALSVPLGTDRSGLPLAVQLVGHRYRDDLVLRAGRQIEIASGGAPRPQLIINHNLKSMAS